MQRNNDKNVSPLSQIHRANLLKRLEHRLEVARANGQHHLIAQLEAERRYYND
ncbi:hypothetical protein [Gloeothece verrucosa]|uniref:Uncharacterized protein n=1 Tax=Gloeothece verrucosa (strain PCC 7822) TaxID=497965 RepID=E0UCQ7_GLOV7|nr:hypothetical protein [Gloeothece verrucosa]ADN15251.1 conserved hypothetical protein [Gloeothece verrucosa PCC 7822]